MSRSTPTKKRIAPSRHIVLSREVLQTTHQRLTARDYDLIDVVGEHEAFTLEQLTTLYFPTRTRATVRVGQLLELDVLDRFRTAVRPGSQRWRYTLGHVGATIRAHHNGEDGPKPRETMNRISKLAARRDQNHLIGVNQFIVHVLVTARTRNEIDVECHAENNFWTGLSSVCPDADLTWIQAGHPPVRAWIEYDTGTETLSRLLKKIERYEKGEMPGGKPALLFLLPSPIREANLQTRIIVNRERGLVATTTHELMSDPAGPIWLVAGTRTRVRLVDLTYGLRRLPATPAVWWDGAPEVCTSPPVRR